MRRASKTEIWSCLESNLFGDDQFGKGLDVAVLGVDGATQFARRADRLFGGRKQAPLRRAWTRTSRLMPFSRSQNSNTAKKSAFIIVSISPSGNKKVGRTWLSDLRAESEFSKTIFYVPILA